MRKTLIATSLALLLSVCAYAQDVEFTDTPVQPADTVIALQDGAVIEMGKPLEAYHRDLTKKYKTRHMIGVKYGYHISGAAFTPDIKPSYIRSPKNYSVLYTYYHDLWDMFPIFGLQTGIKYTTEGFESEWGYNEKYDVVEVPLISQFNFLIADRFRILANGGCFGAYRIKTYRETGWDQNDIRPDYGFIFGAGFGLVFGPFELQLEANIKRSVCSLYQPLKLSDEYWLYGYEQQLMISAALFINLW